MVLETKTHFVRELFGPNHFFLGWTCHIDDSCRNYHTGILSLCSGHSSSFDQFNSLARGRSECDSKNANFNLVLLIGIFRSSHDNALRWMPQDLTGDKSTLVQVMAWCRQATSHYLRQCWISFLSPYGVARPHCKNRYFTNTLSNTVWNLWGRVTHIYVGNLTIIGSDNGLAPVSALGRRQAIIRTNAGILLIGSLGSNFSEILIKIHNLCLNVLTRNTYINTPSVDIGVKCCHSVTQHVFIKGITFRVQVPGHCFSQWRLSAKQAPTKNGNDIMIKSQKLAFI